MLRPAAAQRVAEHQRLQAQGLGIALDTALRLAAGDQESSALLARTGPLNSSRTGSGVARSMLADLKSETICKGLLGGVRLAAIMPKADIAAAWALGDRVVDRLGPGCRPRHEDARPGRAPKAP